MNPDDLRAAWQAQPPPADFAFDPNQLLRQVRQDQRRFDRTIFWRDVREVGIAVVLLPVWVVLGVQGSLPWTWYLTIPVLVWSGGFLVWHRRRDRRLAPGPDAPLSRQIAGLLAQVHRQIWLLSNVPYWSLTPLSVTSSIFVADVGWQMRDAGWVAVVAPAIVLAMFAVVFVIIAWLNLRAVRIELEPRRRELATLLANFADESNEPSGPDQSHPNSDHR